VSRRAVWLPALVLWVAFGVGLFSWLLVGTASRVGPALAGIAPQRTGSTAPADLPVDFPVYPGARAVSAFRGGATASTRGVIYVTPDSESQVDAFYRAAFRERPWRIVATLPFPVRTMSVIHDGEPKFSGSVTIQRTRNGMTELVFEWIPAGA